MSNGLIYTIIFFTLLFSKILIEEFLINFPLIFALIKNRQIIFLVL
ncbi:MAG: hypothetical protein GY679_00300 [Mycoplasma sp.]|nr:hypothetical protein [Mycoplasma sp.]